VPKEQRREARRLLYALVARLLATITVFIVIVGCSAHKSSSIPAFSFLHAPPASHKLIVFVHGFTGDPLATWTNESGASWADLIKQDEQLRDFTVWVHHYDTPFLERTLTIEETGTRFLRQLKDEGVFDKFQEIYFIAHSMGGLVVKRALVDLNRESQADKLGKVKSALFLSTPAQGTSLAQSAALLSLNPQLRDMEPANLNSYLQSIENQWQNLMRDRGNRSFPKSYCAYETKPTYGGIVIVDRISALTSCDDDMFPVPVDHRNIAKPQDAQSDIYRWTRARLLETSRLVQSGDQAAISVQVAPRVLHYVHRFKSEGQTFRQNEYGFGLVLRVRNKGQKIERIKALEIAGDIDADPNDLDAFEAEGKTFEELDEEWGRTQPYYRVSFVSFPINGNKIEPGSEEFVRFMALDPTNLSTMAITRGEEGWKYIGFRIGKARQPLLLTTVPNIFSFVKFTQIRQAVPGNAEWLGPRLRSEIKSGAVKFIIRFESGSREINPMEIQGPSLISWNNWNKLIPQDIYHRNTVWDRAAPMSKDPLIAPNP
jgi:pimeloyl-ACP methyl ester carboxylesterase